VVALTPLSMGGFEAPIHADNKLDGRLEGRPR